MDYAMIFESNAWESDYAKSIYEDQETKRCSFWISMRIEKCSTKVKSKLVNLYREMEAGSVNMGMWWRNKFLQFRLLYFMIFVSFVLFLTSLWALFLFCFSFPCVSVCVIRLSLCVFYFYVSLHLSETTHPLGEFEEWMRRTIQPPYPALCGIHYLVVVSLNLSLGWQQANLCFVSM